MKIFCTAYNLTDSQVTQIMDLLYGGGGDFHTTYWPQPSYLSSRKYYIESTFQCEKEIKICFHIVFALSLPWAGLQCGGQEHDILAPHSSQVFSSQANYYLTKTEFRLGVEGSVCYTCTLNILTKPTLLEIVQVGKVWFMIMILSFWTRLWILVNQSSLNGCTMGELCS